MSGHPSEYKHRRLFGDGSLFTVQRNSFLHVLNRHIEIMNRESAAFYEDQGGLELLAHRASGITGKKRDRYLRRLFDLRAGRTYSMLTEMAEELLIACGSDLREEELPTFPMGKKAARERIEAQLWVKGRMLPDEVIDDLAEDLLEFTRMAIIDAQRKQEEVT